MTFGDPDGRRDATTTGEDDPFVAFTQDAGAAARLQANLQAISEAHAGTPLAEAVTEVLDGRRPIRDLADDPGFSRLVEQGVDDYRAFLASLTPEQRAEMVANAKNEPNPGH